jgi:hypothetical protein
VEVSLGEVNHTPAYGIQAMLKGDGEALAGHIEQFSICPPAQGPESG